MTERGAAFPDPEPDDGTVNDLDRCDYLIRHVNSVASALRGGADVRGFFAWSLLDNFEWAFGYEPRFGITHVKYETQQRTPKLSARILERLAGSARR